MKTSDAGFGLSGAGNVGHIQKNCVVVPHLPVILHCFEEKWGIYKKMLFLCPACLKKGDLEGHFFYICPTVGKKKTISVDFGTHVGHWGRIILYMPGQSYFFFDSVQRVISFDSIQRPFIPNRNIAFV